VILLALVFVFIPFFSVPGLLFSTYTQPVPLLLGWTYLICVFKLPLRKALFLYATIFLFYIFSLAFLLNPESTFSGPSQSVFIAYCIGFSSFLLLLSLFSQSFIKLRSGDSFLAQKICRSAQLTVFIVASTAVLQLVPGFSEFLAYLKPRHVILEQDSLATAFRGISGILPEPSYVGVTCAVMFLIVYWFSFRIYLKNNSHSLLGPPDCTFAAGPVCTPKSRGAQFYSTYSTYLVSFFSSFQNILLLTASLLTVTLAFSPTTLIAYALILASILIPLLLSFCRLRVSLGASFFLSFILASFAFAGVAAYSVFPDSRLSSIVNSVGDNGLPFVVSGSDASSADRAASSIAGLFAIFYHPYGLGLNGHGSLFSDCRNSIILDFELLCGSVFSSSRNHNSLAVYLQDGGIVGVLIAALAFVNSVKTQFFRNYGSFSWVGRLTLGYLLFLFVVLPSPLGAPSVWIALALILSFFAIPSSFESPDSRSHI